MEFRSRKSHVIHVSQHGIVPASFGLARLGACVNTSLCSRHVLNLCCQNAAQQTLRIVIILRRDPRLVTRTRVRDWPRLRQEVKRRAQPSHLLRFSPRHRRS